MEVRELIEPTIEIAKKAGEFIRDERKNFNPERVEFKGFNDLVSYVDKEAEKIVVSGLSKLFPEAGFITEEKTVVQEDRDWKWIVDPLDGTTNFVHGIPVFAVSIGLTFKEQVMLGVVYEINMDECFHAYRGGGAFCNGVPIHVSTAPLLADSLIAIGFPYKEAGFMDAYFSLLKHLLKNGHGLRRLGSAATDLCYVACGRVEGYLEYGIQSYDVAAGSLILEEAGGQVTNLRGTGEFLFAREILGTNGKIHNELRSVISSFFQGDGPINSIA